MFDKLGISLAEQERLAGVAVDAVVDRVSVATTYKKKLAESASSSARSPRRCSSHPELVQKYLGTVVPYRDNFFATLNSAVFSDGSFCFIPAGVKCPMELSTYFRINSADTGQFERTLIVAEEGASVSYLEGCTAPQRDDQPAPRRGGRTDRARRRRHQVLDRAELVPGDKNGLGGIDNFVTERGRCGARLEDLLDAGRDRLGHHVEIPELVLQGDDSVGEFYSVARHQPTTSRPTPAPR